MMLEDFRMMTEPKILSIDLSEEELKKFELPKDKSVANF